jgi:hypothetical protein
MAWRQASVSCTCFLLRFTLGFESLADRMGSLRDVYGMAKEATRFFKGIGGRPFYLHVGSAIRIAPRARQRAQLSEREEHVFAGRRWRFCPTSGGSD